LRPRRENVGEGDKLGLLRSGLLDLSPIRSRVFPPTALPEAMGAAATAGNREYVVMRP
jgi:hypothetical protein